MAAALLGSPLSRQVATNASLSAKILHLKLCAPAVEQGCIVLQIRKMCLNAGGRLMLPVVRRCRQALLPAFVEPAGNSTKQLPKDPSSLAQNYFSISIMRLSRRTVMARIR